MDLDPREDPTFDSLAPMRDLKKVHIGAEEIQTMQIGSGLLPEEESYIIQILRQNMDLFFGSLPTCRELT